MQFREGGCLCGAIRYRVSGTPLYTAICHCQSCRKASAAPSVAWQTYELHNFELLTGKPRTYRSSPGVQRTFCQNCGSPLTFSSEQRATQIDITSVSLDDPEAMPPDREVWLQDKLSWESVNVVRQQFPQGGD
jgi:hypothetical protein